jgi:hypothetical protein
MAFHVVESARILEGPMGSRTDDGPYGAFRLPSPEPGWTLDLICAGGDEPVSEGWEHVSVSARRGKTIRTPTWREMAYVKAQHWDDEDVVVQFHPRQSEYVNVHPHVLHLWRHPTQAFPCPPSTLVG